MGKEDIPPTKQISGSINVNALTALLYQSGTEGGFSFDLLFKNPGLTYKMIWHSQSQPDAKLIFIFTSPPTFLPSVPFRLAVQPFLNPALANGSYMLPTIKGWFTVASNSLHPGCMTVIGEFLEMHTFYSQTRLLGVPGHLVFCKEKRNDLSRLRMVGHLASPDAY